MSPIEEIKGFARDYVNGIGRTPERTRIISMTYKKVFGEPLRVRCGTCIIEAIFKLINHKMATNPCAYRLRKGNILQPFGGGIITNDNLTDEIARECLKNHVANASMFAVMPDETETELEIVPVWTNVIENVVVDDETSIPEIVADPVKSNNRPKHYKKRK